MSTAPNVSNIDASMQACRKVSTFAPTDVPKVLATSFAPNPKARMKAIISPTITIHKYSSPISENGMVAFDKVVLQSKYQCSC